MPSIKLSPKHCAILRSFSDLGGFFTKPRKNCRAYVWDEKTQTVFMDFEHVWYSRERSGYQDLANEPEFIELVAWGLIREVDHPVYELTEKAGIYIA